nr:Chain B, Nuclear receptor coactivator 2 [Homo sapiens]
ANALLRYLLDKD